jgi:ABC-type multidrug transport system permease subunit
MLEYFAQAEHQQQFGTELGGCPACGTTRPEFIFDVLETPLRDLSGDIIYEENAQGQLVPARRFSPDYWRDKYESFRLLQEVRQIAVKKQPAPLLPPPHVRRRTETRLHDEWTKLKVLLKRAFISKLRNRANLLTTIVEAPLLAAVVGAVLRYSETGAYDFASAYHIPTYLFLMLIVSMFLGLTNSADDIIRDRTVLQRERNLAVRLSYYILAKALTLALFAAVQSALFVLIGNAILEARGMFWPYFTVNFLAAMAGVTTGLLISSIVSDGKTAANIVPLILIPQIILGGALIKYEEMNRNLDLSYTFSRWFATHENPEKEESRSKLSVPLVCEFVPMRWAYELIVILQAKQNPLTSRQDQLQQQIDAIAGKKSLTQQESARLDDLKDTLALLSGMECGTAKDVDKRLKRVDSVIEGAPLADVKLTSRGSGVTAESLYVNQKINDLSSKAETEQLDYRRGRPINTFFGNTKYFRIGWGRQPAPGGARPDGDYIAVPTIALDVGVMAAFSLVTLGLLHICLHRQLRTRQ